MPCMGMAHIASEATDWKQGLLISAESSDVFREEEISKDLGRLVVSSGSVRLDDATQMMNEVVIQARCSYT